MIRLAESDRTGTLDLKTRAFSALACCFKHSRRVGKPNRKLLENCQNKSPVENSKCGLVLSQVCLNFTPSTCVVFSSLPAENGDISCSLVQIRQVSSTIIPDEAIYLLTETFFSSFKLKTQRTVQSCLPS